MTIKIYFPTPTSRLPRDFIVAYGLADGCITKVELEDATNVRYPGTILNKNKAWVAVFEDLPEKVSFTKFHVEEDNGEREVVSVNVKDIPSVTADPEIRSPAEGETVPRSNCVASGSGSQDLSGQQSITVQGFPARPGSIVMNGRRWVVQWVNLPGNGLLPASMTIQSRAGSSGRNVKVDDI